MKYIICNTPNGQYKLPLQPIAEDRANYYANEIDGHEIGSDEWKKKVDFCMMDDYEGIDWLLNNTDWEDWKNITVKMNDKVLVTDDDFFCSSDDFEIKEL